MSDQWKLVPIKPTTEMVDALWDALPKGFSFQNCTPIGVIASIIDAAPIPTQGADARPVAIRDRTRDELFAEYFEDREGSAKVAEHAYRRGWKDRATYTVVPGDSASTGKVVAELEAFKNWFSTSGFWNNAITGKAWTAACKWQREQLAVPTTRSAPIYQVQRDAFDDTVWYTVAKDVWDLTGTKWRRIVVEVLATRDAVVWQETDEEGTPLWGENTFAANEGTFEHERALGCIAPMEKT